MTPALLSGEVLTLYAAEEFSLSVLALFFSFPHFPFYILSLRVSHCPPLYPPPPLFPHLAIPAAPPCVLDHLHWRLLSVFCLGSFFSFSDKLPLSSPYLCKPARLYHRIRPLITAEGCAKSMDTCRRYNIDFINLRFDPLHQSVMGKRKKGMLQQLLLSVPVFACTVWQCRSASRSIIFFI